MPVRGLLRILLIGIVCHTALITQAWASDTQRPVLKGAYIEFPPLTYTNDEGEPAGPYIRESSRLAREAGYEVEWRSLPIDRIYLYLREGKIDLWIGSQGVPAIADSTLEPDFTFPPIRLNAYHLAEREPVSGLMDLKGRHLILIRGYTYRNYLNPATGADEARVDTASNHSAALRMLSAGRGDYLLDFEAPVSNALETTPVNDIKHSLITTWETTLVFSSRTEHAETLVRDFEEAYASTETSLRR